MRPLHTPILLALTVLAWIGGCGDDDKRVCVPGAAQACVTRCGDSSQGVQVCASDGKSFSTCACDYPSPAGDSGVGGSGNVPAVSTLAIGAACASDSQCTAGLRCMLSSGNDFGFGGPAGGYCTKDCADAAGRPDPAVCQAVDVASDCLQITPDSSVCLRTCLSKNPRSGENKCLNRGTLSCASTAFFGFEPFSLGRQDGWCLPQCGSDADCGGRVCDLASGLCADTAFAGKALGDLCDLTSVVAECAGGLCLPVEGTAGVCSAYCRYSTVSVGTVNGCGYGTAANPRDAACLLPRVGNSPQQSEGFGDVGICLELCNTPADCAQAGWRCEPMPYEAELGQSGTCFPPLAGDPNPGGGDTPDAAAAPADGG